MLSDVKGHAIKTTKYDNWKSKHLSGQFDTELVSIVLRCKSDLSEVVIPHTCTPAVYLQSCSGCGSILVLETKYSRTRGKGLASEVSTC